MATAYRPTWIVFFGRRGSCKVFRSEYQARLFLEALVAHGTPCQMHHNFERVQDHAARSHA